MTSAVTLWMPLLLVAAVGCEGRAFGGDDAPPPFDLGILADAEAPTDMAQSAADLGVVEGLDMGVVNDAAAPVGVVPGAQLATEGDLPVAVGEDGALIFRVEVPAQEHVGLMLSFEPTHADVVLYVDRFDGTGASALGLTDAGRGIRTLAVYEPDASRTYWVRVESADALSGTLSISRTGFVDGATCIEDCERLLQLPLPVDPLQDGYDWTAGTVMRYWFGRRDLLMFTRYAAREMAAMGYAPFIPEDFSQWDGETPGMDTGYPRHASHQRGKDVDISLYGSDGQAPWRSYCTVVYNGGRECVDGTVDGYDPYANALMFSLFFHSGRVTRSFLDRELIEVTAPAAQDASDAGDPVIDPSVVSNFSDGVHLTHWPNHDNHIHVRVSEEPYTAEAAVTHARAALLVRRGVDEAP